MEIPLSAEDDHATGLIEKGHARKLLPHDLENPHSPGLVPADFMGHD